EIALGSDENDGGPPHETPESYVVDMTVNAAENPPGAGPQTCTNYTYYDVTQAHPADPHQNGAPYPGPGVDDDGDTMVNNADRCSGGNNADEDADGTVNDGCPVSGATSEGTDWCGGGAGDAVDQDGDTTADDGCPGGPPVNGISEAADHCNDVVDDDLLDADGEVNDGCPVVLASGEDLDPGCICPGGDADCDGVLDGPDNCDNDYNPTQLDTDADTQGDACDIDERTSATRPTST
ncbi:MAG: hypothetical protein AMJ77_05080, partial [Dehalococcoidia bacterium SM23_28_2]